MRRMVIWGMMGALFCTATSVPASGVGDHLKCYKVKDTLLLKGPPPSWLDLSGVEFGTDSCKIVGGFRLYCTPAAKTVTQPIQRKFTDLNGSYQNFTPEPVPGPDLMAEDKICYKIKCTNTAPSPPNPTQEVFDQFGNRSVSNFKPYLLCGPAARGTRFAASLDGTQETPPTGSAATGSCTAILSEDQTQLAVSCTHNVVGTTAAHIHNAPPGTPGPIVFPFSSPTSPIVQTWVGLTAGDVGNLLLGNLYVNVHSATFPAGEIRGQLLPSP